MNKQKEFIESVLCTNTFFINRQITRTKNSSYETVYNFRCPICGDSKNNPHKKRGYLINKRNSDSSGFYFHCHNCGKHLTFSKFLKELEIEGLNLYKQWKNIIFIPEKENIEKLEIEINRFKLFNNDLLSYVNKIEDNKNIFNYVIKRKIPEMYWNKKVFSYSGSLYQLIKKDKYDIFDIPKFSMLYHIKSDYLVTLLESFIDGNIITVGFSLRNINSEEARYFKIPIKNLNSTVFSSNIINSEDLKDSPIFVMEGVIDTFMFEMPSISMNSSNLEGIYNIKDLENNIKIFIFDNDYGNNPEIKKKMKDLNPKEKVVLWHLDKKNKYKDANKMIQEGYKYPLDSYALSLTRTGLQKNLYMCKI